MSNDLHAPAGEVHESFVVCRLCLRVWRDASWIDAGEVIREVRSFELTKLPSLLSVMCLECTEAVALKRAP